MSSLDRAARVFGTEEDRLNCPFYLKIGSCRHGEKCNRHHIKPIFSQTLLIPHLFNCVEFSDEQFEIYCLDLIDELGKHGEVEELVIPCNLGEHLLGSVYVKYHNEEQASDALKSLSNRVYYGALVVPEFSPVVDFYEARCRNFDEGECSRGPFCNFIHMKTLSKFVKSEMKEAARVFRRKARGRKRRSRSRSPRRDRKEEKIRSRSKSAEKERNKEKDRERENSAERRARIAAWNQKSAD
jgi:splicing factor U2AF subunit